MNILVVGGAGYIGGYATDQLMKLPEANVAVYDNLLYEERFLKPVKFYHGDIRDTKKLANIANNYDVVILAAALVGDPACSVDPNLTEDINYTAIKNICSQLDPKVHVIFMSTCSVYGAQDGILDENSGTNPLSSYAATKLRAEKYVTDRGGTIFRLGTVYGLGDSFSRIRLDLVVNILTLKAVTEKKITLNGGDQWRPLISVRDIAGYLKEACITRMNGTYILCSENITIRNLGLHVAGILQNNTEITYEDISFQDARNYRVSADNSNKVFKFRCEHTLLSEVTRMANVFKDGRIKNPNCITYNNGKFLSDLKEAKYGIFN